MPSGSAFKINYPTAVTMAQSSLSTCSVIFGSPA